MRRAWWFLALLIGAAAAVPVLGGVFGVRRRRRRRAGLAVVGGWRLALRRLTLVFGTVTFGLAATAAAVNDHYSYIPSFHALFGDVSPDLVSHPVAARSEVGDGAVRSVAKKAADHGTVEQVPVAGRPADRRVPGPHLGAAPPGPLPRDRLPLGVRPPRPQRLHGRPLRVGCPGGTGQHPRPVPADDPPPPAPRGVPRRRHERRPVPV